MGLLSRLLGKKQDGVHFKGEVTATLIRDGKTLWTKKKHNLVVDAGLTHIISHLGTSPGTDMSHMAVGDSATATAANQTALVGTELGRVALDSKTASGKAVTYVATFPAGTATGTIREAGIFNNASTGTMLARYLPDAFVKGASDIYILTWTITAS